MNCLTSFLKVLPLGFLLSFIGIEFCYSNGLSDIPSSISIDKRDSRYSTNRKQDNRTLDSSDDKVKDLDGFFDKYAGMEDVTHVYISKMMLSMAPNIQLDGVDISSKISKLDNLQILTCRHRKNSKYTNLQVELEAIVTSENGYEELMRMKSGEELVIICTKELKARKKREFLLYRKDRIQLTLLVFRGTLTLEELKDVVNMEGVNRL